MSFPLSSITVLPLFISLSPSLAAEKLFTSQCHALSLSPSLSHSLSFRWPMPMPFHRTSPAKQTMYQFTPQRSGGRWPQKTEISDLTSYAQQINIKLPIYLLDGEIMSLAQSSASVRRAAAVLSASVRMISESLSGCWSSYARALLSLFLSLPLGGISQRLLQQKLCCL